MLPDEIRSKYNLLYLLHQGIGGDVWLAEHKRLGGKRVLKFIEKSHPQYELLADEAKILQQCQHPSIPIIYDILEFDTQTCIIEEFIQGETLKQYIARQRRISASLLLELSMQLCDILIFLHNPARQILHLDIKPENILLANHKLKLIDFGSAICRSQNETSVIFGTPAYCAPEMKSMGNLTERTDIYCMGKCMEYLMLHASGIPKGYQRIVNRCLRNGEEYATADEVRKALEKIRKRKSEEKGKEMWFAVTGVLSSYDGSMTALQLAMYLRDRYRKPVLYLDCTGERLMEQLESCMKRQKSKGETKNFVFEQENITVVKRVTPQELGGWRNRGYSYVVVCFGELNPLYTDGPYKRWLLTGAVTEFSLERWKTMVCSLKQTCTVAVAVTGGDVMLAQQDFQEGCRVQPLSTYFELFGASKPFRRQMKCLLGKL